MSGEQQAAIASRMLLERGLVQIYTGEGKGKSTASMGLMVRALGRGLKVYYLRMMKPRWKTGERTWCPQLHPNLTFENVQQDWILSRSKHIPEHVETMRTALVDELGKLKAKLASGEYDLMIVDEIIYCVHLELIPVDAVIDLIGAKPPHVELVLTGRHAPQALIDHADLVTEMRKVKHPFDQGIRARRGIEF